MKPRLFHATVKRKIIITDLFGYLKDDLRDYCDNSFVYEDIYDNLKEDELEKVRLEKIEEFETMLAVIRTHIIREGSPTPFEDPRFPWESQFDVPIDFYLKVMNRVISYIEDKIFYYQTKSSSRFAHSIRTLHSCKKLILQMIKHRVQFLETEKPVPQ